MENLFYEEAFVFETSESIYSSRLDSYILEYTEAYNKKHYITESEHKSLLVKIKEFFTNIITSLKTFHTSIITKLRSFARENTIEIKLRSLRKELNEKKDNGQKYIKTIDLVKYEKTYIKMVDSLWEYAQKFEKVDYRTVDQIDRDLAKFNSLYEKYNTELDEIAKKEYTMKITDAINFVSKEIDGRSKVIETINQSINKVKEMKTSAENLELKRNTLGSDVIPKHVFFLKRMCNSITAFIRKAVSKFITVVVFLFA
jgi:DNA repair ATPase RecN